MSSTQLAFAHDAFVRTALTDPRVIRAFFAVHLPENLCKLIDLDHLKLQPRSYIDEVRKESIVDLLYKTTLGDQEVFLYLLVEHQSSPDALMPFRILKYICNVMDHHLKTTKQKKLPLVYPMVIYHAESAYPYTTDIKDLVNAPRELIEKYFLKPFQLIDLGQIEDEELKTHAWAGIVEFVLKHIYARDILPFLQDIAEYMRKIVIAGGNDVVALVLQYALQKGSISDKSAFFNLIHHKISSEMEEKVMTLGEQLRAEGKAEGKAEVAEHMLKAGADFGYVARMTGLSIEVLKNMQESSKSSS